MIYLVNAFSLNMLEVNGLTEIEVLPLRKTDAIRFLTHREFVSAIGHSETANTLASELGMNIEHNRITVKLGKDDVAIVAQYSGSRLDETAIGLPDDAEMRYYLVRVVQE